MSAEPQPAHSACPFICANCGGEITGRVHSVLPADGGVPRAYHDPACPTDWDGAFRRMFDRPLRGVADPFFNRTRRGRG